MNEERENFGKRIRSKKCLAKKKKSVQRKIFFSFFLHYGMRFIEWTRFFWYLFLCCAVIRINLCPLIFVTHIVFKLKKKYQTNGRNVMWANFDQFCTWKWIFFFFINSRFFFFALPTMKTAKKVFFSDIFFLLVRVCVLPFD